MDISARHLRAFLAVSEALNFTRAAEEVGVSQPALSATIQQLEQMLGARLFDRAGRRVALTEMGALYRGIARRLLSEIEASRGIVRDFVEKRKGRLNVAALPSAAAAFVAPELKRYRRTYPSVQLTVSDGTNDEILELVRRGEVDMGFGICEPDDRDFDVTVVLHDRFVAVVPPDHALARKYTLQWRDLVGHPFIRVAKGSNTRRIVDDTFARIGHALDSAITTNIVPTAVGLVAHGLGVTVLSDLSTAPFAKLGVVATRPLDAPQVSRPIGLITRAGRSLAPAAEAFRHQVLKRDG